MSTMLITPMANRMHRSTTKFLTPIISHPPIGFPSMTFLKFSKDNERATDHVVVVVVETIDSGCTHLCSLHAQFQPPSTVRRESVSSCGNSPVILGSSRGMALCLLSLERPATTVTMMVCGMGPWSRRVMRETLFGWSRGVGRWRPCMES